jgi:hypothetical protein
VEGPYLPEEIVFGSFSHNTEAVLDSDGMIIVFHESVILNKNKPVITDCTNGTTPVPVPQVMNDFWQDDFCQKKLPVPVPQVMNNSASAQVGGTGGEQGCVGAALPATKAGSGEFGLEGTGRVL